jgi:GT2 family glycosyltransferase
MACHNRRVTTLECLQALYSAVRPDGYSLDVYLVDDGSTDGTAASVRARFPKVRLIEGTGDLYWNRGMRLAFAKAIQAHPDFYLWLNDDTILETDGLTRLFSTYNHVAAIQLRSVVVGSTRDRDSGDLTYGGVVHRSRWHPLRLDVLPPADVPLPCDTFFGNCVLIPHSVAQVVGNLDPTFTHSAGDADYGFRARKRGCMLWIAPGFVATCSRNSEENTWEDPLLPLRERWRLVRSPKGLPPQEWRVMLQRQAPTHWPFLIVLPYLRLLLGALRSWFQRKRKWSANRNDFPI